MKETGLMFKAPLVRAILEGRKTQTRRIVKGVGHDNCIQVRQPGKTKAGVFSHVMDAPKLGLCPMGQTGDRIYVRETWNWFDPQEIPADRIGQRAPFTGCQGKREIPWAAAYAADGPLPYPGYDGKDHWQPSIHMPKWAARIWLEITSVRVERLQSISTTDCMAEGITTQLREYDAEVNLRKQFQELWDSTTGRPALPANKNSKRYARVKHWLDTHPDTTGWTANPWVWVIDFKTISTTGRPA